MNTALPTAVGRQAVAVEGTLFATKSDDQSEVSVRVTAHWYSVDLGPMTTPRVHHVGKDRRCTCARKGDCPAVTAVAEYLRRGGPRAPDPRDDFWGRVPRACPICGGATIGDRDLNSKAHGWGWRCLADPTHYWLMRLPRDRRAQVRAVLEQERLVHG